MPKTTYRINFPDAQDAHVTDFDIVEAVRTWNEAVANTKRVTESPEFAAREELRAQLDALKQNDLIRRSESCVSLLDDLAKCVGWAWARTDTASLVEPLAPHFKSESNRKTAMLRGQATDAADAPYREHLDNMPGGTKKNRRVASLRSEFRLTADEADAIYRRWRDSGKRRTPAGSRPE